MSKKGGGGARCQKSKTKPNLQYQRKFQCQLFLHSFFRFTLLSTATNKSRYKSLSREILPFHFIISFSSPMILSRNNSSSQPEIDDAATATDVGFNSIRGRFPFKRNPSHSRDRHRTSSDRQLPKSVNSSRSHLHNRFTRKGLLSLFPFFKSKSGFYALIIVVVFLFALASMVMQSSITSVFRQSNDRSRYFREGLKFGSTLKFVPGRVSQRFLSGDGLDRLRSQPRIGVRAPRIALVSSVNFLFLKFSVQSLYCISFSL